MINRGSSEYSYAPDDIRIFFRVVYDESLLGKCMKFDSPKMKSDYDNNNRLVDAVEVQKCAP